MIWHHQSWLIPQNISNALPILPIIIVFWKLEVKTYLILTLTFQVWMLSLWIHTGCQNFARVKSFARKPDSPFCQANPRNCMEAPPKPERPTREEKGSLEMAPHQGKPTKCECILRNVKRTLLMPNRTTLSKRKGGPLASSSPPQSLFNNQLGQSSKLGRLLYVVRRHRQTGSTSRS